MPASLVEDFEMFFIELPCSVRDDLLFMMVVLSDESLVVHEVKEVYERAAHELLLANTQMGRIGNLIHTCSILDVYFAIDLHDRFGAARTGSRRQSGDWISANTSRDPYAERIEAIEAAKRRWQELRATKFSSAALAAALIPSDLRHKRRRQVSEPANDQIDDSEVLRDALS